MKLKKIQYVSLEAGAFLSDLAFQAMNAEERGVYCSLLLYLYENNGKLPFNVNTLKRLCNCENFEKVWEVIKQKFIVKKGFITHKRVSRELERAKQFLQAQSEKGVKGAQKRWSNNGSGISTAITKRSEEKRSEETESNNSNSNPSSAFKSVVSSLRHATTASLEMEAIRCYDVLGGIFRGRTVSDTTSLRNLVRWVKENIAAGKFQPEIFKTIVNMATDSKNGKSRKPIAVFFAQVKRDLGYKADSN